MLLRRVPGAQEIERAIDALTPPELEELCVWLDQHHPQPIDARLQADLEGGRIEDGINRLGRSQSREHTTAVAAA